MSNSEQPAFISDGKRMRAIWLPGDGPGESTRHTVERSMSNNQGHPTWKVYIGDIKIPILRDTVHEPPHYVYLDDKACYTVWRSGVYTNEELHQFWAFDFDQKGNIRPDRKNRGRPAYSDGTSSGIAKAPLRGSDKWYEFFGQPEEVSAHQPRAVNTASKVEINIKEEIAKEASENSRQLDHAYEKRPGPSTGFFIDTKGSSTFDPENTLSSQSLTSSSTRSLPLNHAESDSPSVECSISYNNRTSTEQRAMLKRKDTGSLLSIVDGSSSAFFGPKRLKLCQGFSKGQVLNICRGLGADNTHGDGEYASDIAFGHLRDENNKLEYALQSERESVQQLRTENRALVLQNKNLLEEQSHLREVCIQLLAEKIGQRKDLDHRVIALQRLSNDVECLSNQLKKTTLMATKDIAPTERLSEDIGCVLGRTEKHMYERGQEELWRELQTEAEKLSLTQGSSTPSSSQPKTWGFC